VTTIVNGRPLMRERRVLSVDEDSMMERSRRAAHSLARRAGIVMSSGARRSGLSGNWRFRVASRATGGGS